MAWTAPRTWVTSEVPPASTMNTHLRDNLNVLRWAGAYKSADEVVNASTVVQDDNHLFTPVGANETWLFETRIIFTTVGVAGFRWTMTGPTGSAGSFWAMFFLSPSTALGVGATETALGTDASAAIGGATQSSLCLRGFITNGLTPGNLRLRWAQDVSDAGATTVKIHSWLVAHRIV